MSPQVAARRFVARVLRKTFADMLDLTEREVSAYTRIEAAVRAQHPTRVHDLAALEQAIRDAAPKAHRAAVAKALERFCAARDEEMNTTQQSAYLIGIEVGRALWRSPAGKVGTR